MNSLTKSERLHSYGAIRRLFNEGRSGFVYPFRFVYYTEQSTSPVVALLFSTPKKFHKRANKRNTLRRRMREVYRLNKSLIYNTLGDNRIEIALVYSSKTIHDYQTIEHAIKKVLEQISAEL